MELHYELSPADVGAAQSLFWRRRRPLFFWGFSIYGACFFLFGVWQASRGQVSALIPLIFGAWSAVFVPLLLPRTAKKNWTKTRALHGPTTLGTSPEGLEVANPMTRTFVRWEVMGDVVEGPQVWIVFLSPTSFYVLPTRAFASDNDKARLRAEFSRSGLMVPVAGSGAPPLASP